VAERSQELSDADAEAEAIVDEFDAAGDYVVTGSDALAELRAAAAARREADSREILRRGTWAWMRRGPRVSRRMISRGDRVHMTGSGWLLLIETQA
jgi:hypothetical protein